MSLLISQLTKKNGQNLDNQAHTQEKRHFRMVTYEIYSAKNADSNVKLSASRENFQ